MTAVLGKPSDGNSSVSELHALELDLIGSIGEASVAVILRGVGAIDLEASHYFTTLSNRWQLHLQDFGRLHFSSCTPR